MKEIKLTRGKVALVDDEDFEKLEYLKRYKWQFALRGKMEYATLKVKGKHIYMHRYILGITDPSIDVDHKDRNGLNNQKSNLRKANRSENLANTKSREGSSSKFMGVHWHKKGSKWTAQITKNGKITHLGLFKTENEAALAYNAAAKVLHKSFANINIL